MSCTILDHIDILAGNYGEGGICPDETSYPQLIRALNTTIPIIMKRLDAKGTLTVWKVPVRSMEFCLPIDCLEARQVWFNGRSLEQRDGWFEGKLGVGLNPQRGWPYCDGGELIDEGDGFPLPFRWPPHFDTRLGLIAENDGDAGKSVEVQFTNRNNELVTETIVLLKDQQLAITQSDVTDVKFVRKGLTCGAVRANIYYPQTKASVWTGTWPSYVVNPMFRKKKLPMCFPVGCNNVVVKGKMRFYPIQSETDPLPICDGAALAFGIRAYYAMTRGDLVNYNENIALSVNELEKELQDNVAPGVVAQVSFVSPYGKRSFKRCWR